MGYELREPKPFSKATIYLLDNVLFHNSLDKLQIHCECCFMFVTCFGVNVVSALFVSHKIGSDRLKLL